MKERRRYKRFIVDILDINSSMIFAKNVKIHDISLGGVALRVDKRLNIGSEYGMKIEGKGKVLSLKGIVIWSFLSESLIDTYGNAIPVYRAGLQFTNVTNDMKSEIESFIDDHKKDLGKQVDISSIRGTRLHLRFKIEAPEKAILSFHESYKVKKIGLGGMLVESDHALETEHKFPMEIAFTEDKAIKFLGRVASCYEVKNRDTHRYHVGVEYLDISERNKVVLHEFVRLLDNMDQWPSSV